MKLFDEKHKTLQKLHFRSFLKSLSCCKLQKLKYPDNFNVSLFLFLFESYDKDFSDQGVIVIIKHCPSSLLKVG